MQLKTRYRQAQIKAASRVNAEKLLFNRRSSERRAKLAWAIPSRDGGKPKVNWQLGRELVIKKAEERWGTGIVEQVALDLQTEFPSPFSLIPWGHHILIMRHSETADEAIFYIRKTIAEGWSRQTLTNCLNAKLYKEHGHALTNFSQLLPEAQSRLAQEIVKDNYDLSFISLRENFEERDLEDALERNIIQFLLELGNGFAFMGRQKEILISGVTRRIDLLFYHIRLRCYVVIELKAKTFEPEYASKLNFYVNAVDRYVMSSRPKSSFANASAS